MIPAVTMPSICDTSVLRTHLLAAVLHGNKECVDLTPEVAAAPGAGLKSHVITHHLLSRGEMLGRLTAMACC